jgi:hypothetical protein
MNILITIVIIGLTLVGIFFYMRRRASRNLIDRIDSAIQLVQVATYVRLKQRYKGQFSEDFASLLSAAILNELFSSEPTNDRGFQFAKENAILIQEKLSELTKDARLRTIMTQTMRVRSAFRTSLHIQSPEEAFKPLDKLNELGILIPGGDAPKLDLFLHLVREYCQEHGV